MPTNKRTYSTGSKNTNRWGYYTSNRNAYSTYGGYNFSTGTTGKWPTTTYSPTQFNTYKKTVTAKLASFKAINQQFTGSGRVTAFSPSGAAKWISFINKGANVYTFSNSQFTRFFGTQWSKCTPTVATRFLKNKFGNGILAVTKGKGNNWLIAATPTVSGRPFNNYNWK